MDAEKLALASIASVELKLGVLHLHPTKRVGDMHFASVEKTVAAIHVTVQRLTRLLVGSPTVNVERIVPVKHAPVPEPKCSQQVVFHSQNLGFHDH